MICSVEISYYPLKDEFKSGVKTFINSLSHCPDIKVEVGSISTKVFGEYSVVMEHLTQKMEEAFENPNSVFVLKILNMDRDKQYPNH